MSIRQELRSRFAASPTFACECCGLTYDRDRLNCPACGGGVHEAN